MAAASDERRNRLLVAGSMVVLMGLAALPRLAGLREWMLSGDDAWHALLASPPSLRELFVETLHRDAHPPLYYLVLRAAVGLGLTGEPLMLRVPGLMAGILCIPSFYGLGRVVAKSRAGGLSLAVLAAFSHGMIHESQPLRGYSLLMLLSSLMMWCFFSSWRFKQAGYLACALLATQTHYVAIIPVAVIALVGLVRHSRDWLRTGQRVHLVAVVAWSVFHLLVFLLVWLEVRAHDWHPWMKTFLARFMPTSAAQLLTGFIEVVSSHHLGTSAAAPWLLVVPFVAGVAVLVAQRRWEVLTVAIAPLVIALTLGCLRIYPLLSVVRYSCWLFPVVALPIAVAIAALARLPAPRRIPLLVAVILMFAANQAAARSERPWHPDELRIRSDWSRKRGEEETLFAQVRTQVAEGETVVVSWSEDRRDRLARQLGWQSHVFPRAHLIRSDVPEAPPESAAVDYEIGPGDLHRSLRLATRSPAWVLVGPCLPANLPNIERSTVADTCLGNPRVFTTSRYLLVTADSVQAGCP